MTFSSMSRVLGTSQMKAVDTWTIQDFGLGAEVLMETAGRAVAEVSLRRYTDVRRVLVVFGPGHNGADGLVAARMFSSSGVDVKVVSPCSREALSSLCLTQLKRCELLGIECCLERDSEVLFFDGSRADIYVDALFGVSLSRDVSGMFATWVERLNSSGKPVVSVDIPSGICGDSGQICGLAVNADLTVTFQYSKFGHWLFPGAEARGSLEVVDIGIPPVATNILPGPSAHILDGVALALRLPRRPNNGHKGSFGHLGIVGGHLGMTGAAKLAGMAGMRVGTGKVSLLCDPLAFQELSTQVSVLMCQPDATLRVGRLPEGFTGTDGVDAFVIGVGVEPSTVSSDFARHVFGDRPRVLDAGALTWLAKQEVTPLGKGCIITPHPGEAARLLRVETSAVQTRRVWAAESLAQRFQCTVVLKGAHTIIASDDGRIWINARANSGLATAGTGDVLAGIIGGWLAQGCEAIDAAQLGVFWHSQAGVKASNSIGERSMIASDVLDCLAEVFKC